MGEFARVAVVTDIEWIRMGVKVMAPLTPCPVQVFHVAELATAKAWIAEDDRPGKKGPRADVTRKLPLAEDMMPPER
jgi:hypothetical protein